MERDPVADVLAVECPACGPDHTELGHVGFPCLDVGGGRVQMACLSRIRAALAMPRGEDESLAGTPRACKTCQGTGIWQFDYHNRPSDVGPCPTCTGGR